MTNLSQKIQKSERLQFREIGGSSKRMLATIGSKENHYQITFSHHLQKIKFDNQLIDVRVFEVDCQRIDTSNGKLNPIETCKGNCQHTVCYHCLGGLRHIFEKDNKSISFYDNVFSTGSGLNLGGKIALVKSPHGGSVWAIVREAPVKVEDKLIVNLMRGTRKEDEGID